MTRTRVVPFLLASLLFLGAAPDEKPVKDWPLFTAPDGSFSVRLPGKPEVSGPPSNATYLVRFGDTVTYYVNTQKLPDPKLIYMGEGTIGVIHSAPAEGFNQARADEYLASFQFLEGKKGSER